MPVLPNGKTDTKALPEIDEQSLKVEYMAPTTPAEEIIVKAFEAVFNQKIGIHDDFTALGGDSLTSIKVTSLLASYNITLSPSVVLNSKTPEKIAKILEEEFKYQVTLARKGTTDQNMFLIPLLSGHHWHIPLSFQDWNLKEIYMLLMTSNTYYQLKKCKKQIAVLL